jgi:hypothetical protein
MTPQKDSLGTPMCYVPSKQGPPNFQLYLWAQALSVSMSLTVVILHILSSLLIGTLSPLYSILFYSIPFSILRILYSLYSLQSFSTVYTLSPLWPSRWMTLSRFQTTLSPPINTLAPFLSEPTTMNSPIPRLRGDNNRLSQSSNR